MEYIKEVLGSIAEWIEVLGIFILIYGFVKFFLQFLLNEFYKNPLKTPIHILQKIRCNIGVYILLALDFLIASDIIFSISDLSWEQLIRLSVMILIRTTIGFFLGKEIEELKTEND